MKLLAEIRQQEVLPEAPVLDESVLYAVRKTARAVMIDGSDRVALIHVARYGFHKLPGGGIEGTETILAALRRELMEETGCEFEVIHEVGCIIWYRDYEHELQLSYCYLTRFVRRISQPNLTDKEKAGDFQIDWCPIDTAVSVFDADRPLNRVGRFIINRDRRFLVEAIHALRS